MGMKSKYIALAIMEAFMFAQHRPEDTRKTFSPPIEPKKVIPAGCEEFEFRDDYGNVFTCISLTAKSAKKKFNKWLKNNGIGSKLRPNTLKSF